MELVSAGSIIALLTLANTIASLFKGKAEFADGTVSAQEDIDVVEG